MTEFNQRYLVLTDIDAVQSYLFTSVRMAMITGASRIVVEFDDYLKTEAEKVGGEVLAHSGGSAIVVFNDENVARNFRDQAKAEFHERSVNGHLTTAGPVAFEPHDFDVELVKAYAQLETEKRLGFAGGEPVTHAMGRRCTTCGRETASLFDPQINLDVGATVSEAGNWYGPACHAKWVARSERWKSDAERSNRAEDWIDWLNSTAAWSGLVPENHLARKFSDFCSERERMALIVADVNGVGERLEGLPNDNLKCFANGLTNAIRRSLVVAIDAACEPYRGEVLAGQRRLPLMVLFHGGDDLVVACRDKLALTFINALTNEFKRQNGQPDADGNDWNDGQPLGLSACAVVSGAGFPFRTSHQIASRLLSEAKEAAREQVQAARDGSSPWRHRAVDFAVVSESYAHPESIVSDRGKTDATAGAEELQQFHFTGRPYCVGGGTPRSFARVLEASAALRQFPGSRLQELREICSLETLRKVIDDEDEFGKIQKVFATWRDRYCDWRRRTGRNPTLQQQWSTALGHLEVQPGSGLVDSSETQRRTVVGDFAEILGLMDREQSDEIDSDNPSR